MKKREFTIKMILFILCINVLNSNLKAQTTKELNQILPMDLVDERGNIYKTIDGMGFMVRADIHLPIQWIDACNSQTDYGKLNLELIWYDLSDETAKYMLEMQEELGGIDQDKENFLGKGNREDFAGGSLRLNSSTKACINEITGPTGKIEYQSEAFYFCFTGTTFIKLSINSAIKPETIKSIINKIAEESKEFDFSVYKSISSQKD
ncbi:MAG: hypothetical protein K9H49_04195 [Bacteroidales bacterium]|nr:hypothetical protein [Bacteroidales bacterium]MCF8390028.1 hypothetical protein [Bacteroidales bacterium]